MKDFWESLTLFERFCLELWGILLKFAVIASIAGCGAVVADTGDYDRAVVAIADSDPDPRPKLPDSLEPKTGDAGGVVESEPESVGFVIVYSTQGCAACEKLKADVANYRKLTFSIRTKHPEWVESFPTLHWRGHSGWVQQSGWSGLVPFLATYNASQKPPVKATAVRSRGPHWTWPGDVGEHLISDHGYSRAQVRGMSQAERIAAHDAAHNGYAMVPRRRRISALAGMCPGGCP